MKTRILRSGRFVRHESLRILAICCILLFAILPLCTLAFNVTGKDWTFILKDRKFSEAIRNSLIYTGSAAVITTVLALITSL